MFHVKVSNVEPFEEVYTSRLRNVLLDYSVFHQTLINPKAFHIVLNFVPILAIRVKMERAGMADKRKMIKAIVNIIALNGIIAGMAINTKNIPSQYAMDVK